MTGVVRMEKTRIYGTVGPACDQEQVLLSMLQKGMTGVRINLSHTALSEMKETLWRIRDAFRRAGKQPDILIDMQGPELRIGRLKQELSLKEGDAVTLGAGAEIPVDAAIFQKLDAGQRVKLDDGRILLEIQSVGEGYARAVVLREGLLASRKSIAIEGIASDFPALTRTDLENLRLAKDYGVTGLMQPFVRNAQDLEFVRRALSDCGAVQLKIYAKIENLQGVRKLPEIIGAADEIIIARGDLGNAMPLWKLPGCQKQIAAACRNAGKPFMVVTQMLASMEHSRVPTRAEVSDIYNAVLDGASSVMVTGETAVGENPVEVIEYLANTCREAEKAESVE